VLNRCFETLKWKGVLDFVLTKHREKEACLPDTDQIAPEALLAALGTARLPTLIKRLREGRENLATLSSYLSKTIAYKNDNKQYEDNTLKSLAHSLIKQYIPYTLNKTVIESMTTYLMNTARQGISLEKTTAEKNREKEQALSEQALSEAIQSTDRVSPKLRPPNTFRHAVLPASIRPSTTTGAERVLTSDCAHLINEFLVGVDPHLTKTHSIS
jgi:hypothetical protein